MKKFTLLFLYLFIGIFVFAQKATTLLSQDFSGGVPPTGWTIDNMASQWSQSSSTKAGGTAPEAKLTYVSGTHTTHLISPEIDLTGLSTVVFSFKHFLDNFSGSGYTIGVATRSGGGAWNDVWTINPTGDMGPETKDIIISNSDVGTSDFQVCIYLIGNMYNFNYWYIDDVSLISPDNIDVRLSSVNTLPYVQTGNIDIPLIIKNVGISEINTLEISYQVNSEPIVTETISGLTLATSDTYNYTFTNQVNIASALSYNLTVWTNLTGDQDNNNDTIKTSVSGVASVPYKRVIGEEAGGTWCGWCPRGLVALKDLAHYHPDDWIGIAVHNNDPMKVSSYDDALTSFTGGGWPNGTVDRIEPTDPGDFSDAYTNRKNDIVPAEVFIQNINWDENTRTVSFDVKANFVTELNGIYKLNAVITENNVSGETSSWAQKNYYSHSSQNIDLIDWEGINWKDLPQTVPAADMVYNHVAISVLGGWDGTDNSVPAHVINGDSAVYSYSYTVPENQKEWDLEIIGFIIDSSSGHILNAVKVESPVTGYIDNTKNDNIRVSPNPASDYINISGVNFGNIFISDISGKQIISQEISDTGKKINIRDFKPGIYFIRIISENNIVTKKFIKK